MPDLPSLVFSTDAKLLSERMVIMNLPRFTCIGEVESSFFASMKRGDCAGFTEFCRKSIESSLDNTDFRIYQLINLYPFRFAFCEKNLIDGKTYTVVFLSKKLSDLHVLMSPSSQFYRDITCRTIYEIMRIDGQMGFNYAITPEALSVFTHHYDFAENLLSEMNKPVYCDLEKLVQTACRRFSEKTKFTFPVFNSENDPSDELNIIEAPSFSLIFVLVSALTILHSLSDDHKISIDIHRFSYAAEICLTVHSSLISKIPRECGSIIDLVRSFPSFDKMSKITTFISQFSGIIVSIDSDRSSEIINVTLGVGFDYQSEPDFKFSDPLENVGTCVDTSLEFIGSI